MKKNQKLLFKFPQQPEQSLVNERGCEYETQYSPSVRIPNLLSERRNKKPYNNPCATPPRAALSECVSPLLVPSVICASQVPGPFLPKADSYGLGGGVGETGVKRTPRSSPSLFLQRERENTRNVVLRSKTPHRLRLLASPCIVNPAARCVQVRLVGNHDSTGHVQKRG